VLQSSLCKLQPAIHLPSHGFIAGSCTSWAAAQLWEGLLEKSCMLKDAWKNGPMLESFTAGSTLSDVTEMIGLDGEAQTLAAGSVAHLLAAQVRLLL
jgi:hypothetical protein